LHQGLHGGVDGEVADKAACRAGRDRGGAHDGAQLQVVTRRPSQRTGQGELTTTTIATTEAVKTQSCSIW
jgi:hypothetical protein